MASRALSSYINIDQNDVDADESENDVDGGENDEDDCQDGDGLVAQCQQTHHVKMLWMMRRRIKVAMLIMLVLCWCWCC